MKKINYIFLSLISLSLLTILNSCEELRFGDNFLEKPLTQDASLEVVYSSKELSEQALANVYTTLPDGLFVNSPYGKSFNGALLESLTDINNNTKTYDAAFDYYSGSINETTDGSKIKCNYSKGGFWQGIRKAWTYIENVHKVPDMTDEEKKVRIAEAKAIIGIHYTHLFRHFGGLQWVDHAYISSEDMSNLPRLSVEETVNKIVAILDEAAADLPITVSVIDNGRMTKAAALGTKVRLLLFAASPLFNSDEAYMPVEDAGESVWYGNYDKARWVRAMEAGEEFFKECAGLELVGEGGGDRYDFRRAYFERGHSELLISTRRVNKYGAGVWASGATPFFPQCNYGIAGTTLDYVDMFQMKTDGSEFDWNNPEHRANPFFDEAGNMVRDPRLYETVLINGDEFQGGKAETFVGGSTYGNVGNLIKSTGFGMRKFRQDMSSSNGGTTVNKFYSWPYLRLSEIYLSYAEAINEANDGPNAIAYDYVNRVRNRVGMPSLTAGLSKEEFSEAVIKERALEFGYEEVRFFDLVRYKREDIFKKQLRRMVITKEENMLIFTEEAITTKRAWQGENWNPKWYLSAFPVSEVNKKYGLTQNPGW